MKDSGTIVNKDKEILRLLAKQVLELANSPRMQTLKREWTEHNSLKGKRPMVCVSPEGSWDEILTEASLKCEHPIMRGFEYSLRQKLYWGLEIGDDTPISSSFNVHHICSVSPYGAGMEESKERVSEKGSFHYDKLIEDIEEDFHKLSFRKVSYHKDESRLILDKARDCFGDILNVRHRGQFWWTLGITSELIKLIGLEEMMFAMYDTPEALHKLMAWFRDEHLSLMEQYKELGILSMNNEEDLIASGGIGYTDELCKSGDVDYGSLWGFSESQETVGISPEMFGEFVFPYQKPMLEKFGLNCYGCCEPVEGRWEWIKTIPRLRRISVSPWSNKEKMAQILKKDYIFSRKPNPSYVCKGFDEDAIRQELRTSMAMAGDINLEIILKDTHTVEHHPERFKKWVEIAREYA